MQDRPVYRRRAPEGTVLYRILAEHLQTFVERIHTGELRWPGFVSDELSSFLDCGILARGFALRALHAVRRGRAGGVLLPGPGLLPELRGQAHGRHGGVPGRPGPAAGAGAAVGADAPYRMRYLCAYEPELCRSVRKIFVRAVFSHLRRRGKERGVPEGRSGAVVFVQRFDSALMLNVHFHALFLDGVFAERSGRMVFHSVRSDDEDIARLTRQIHGQENRACTAYPPR